MIKRVNINLVERKEEIVKGDNCPICKLNGNRGALCSEHAKLTSDFNWLRNYINNLDENEIDKDVVYVLEFAISTRISYIINDVEVVNGRLQVKEHLELLEKKKTNLYMERKLKEILALQKAKSYVMTLVKEVD